VTEVSTTTEPKKPSAIALAREAAKRKAQAIERGKRGRQARLNAAKKHPEQQTLKPNNGTDQHDQLRVYAVRAPPIRLLSKREILAITGVSAPTIWAWMRDSDLNFPRSRIVGGKTFWIESEVVAWIESRPLSQLTPADQLAELKETESA
jgi:predicted DNA-binding transcriptional regulator AlpA